VTFDPRAEGLRTAQMAIASDADGSPHRVTLRGTGTLPQPALTPTAHAFQNVQFGTGARSLFTFTVSNSGKADLQVDSVSVSGSGRDGFRVDTENCTSTRVAPGQTCAIKVMFRPSTVGLVSARLIVTHAKGALEADLSGRGTEPSGGEKPGHGEPGQEKPGTKPGQEKPGDEPKPGTNPSGGTPPAESPPPQLVPVTPPAAPPALAGGPPAGGDVAPSAGGGPAPRGPVARAGDERVVRLGSVTLRLLTAGPSGDSARTLTVTPAVLKSRRLAIASVSCCSAKAKAESRSKRKVQPIVVSATAKVGKVRVGSARMTARSGRSVTLAVKLTGRGARLLGGAKAPLAVTFTASTPKSAKKGVSVTRTFILRKSSTPARRR
jgi:hypothetical protein